MTSIEVADLTKSYSHMLALDHLNFKYEGNRIVGYLGPNGAGKTTTLKLITAMLKPDSGRALLNGIDVYKDMKKALWNTGVVIETPEPYPYQSIEESLTMVGKLRGMNQSDILKQIKKYGDLLEIPPINLKAGKLSKGQRQRVVLAGALIHEPEIILLDEPTSGLDPAERVRVRDVLKMLKKDRLILMSSHMLSEVTEVCDNVIFINRGKMILKDTVANVNQRFKSTVIEVEFLEPVSIEKLSEMGSIAKNINAVADRKYSISYEGAPEIRGKILASCQKAGTVISFKDATLGLEDAYLQLVN